MELQDHIFVTAEQPVSATTIIPIVDSIVEKDLKTGQFIEREIRYVPGEKSIYIDEQSKNADKKAKHSAITLTYGLRIVSGHEITLLEFLRKCNYNSMNPNRKPSAGKLFYERIPGKQSEEFVNKDFKTVNIKSKIHNMTGTELEAVAYAIGMTNASTKLLTDLKRDLIITAEKNEDLFINAISDMRTTRVYHVVNLAIESGFIRIVNNTIENQIGKEVFSCGFGSDVMQEFVEWLKRAKGASFYNQLLQHFDPEDGYKQVVYDDNDVYLEKEEEEIEVQKQGIDLTKVSPEHLMNLALEKGILSKSGKNIFYHKDGKEIMIAKSSIAMTKKIMSDGSFRRELIDYIATRN